MKNRILMSWLLLLSYFSVDAQNPTDAEMLKYIRNNLKIYYIADPNADKLEIWPVNKIINQDKFDYVFGKADDDKMFLSSSLIRDLFEDNKKSIFKNIRETVYQILQISNKQVNILFINDVQQPIKKEKVDLLHLFTIPINKKNWAIWPGIYEAKSNKHPNIIMGELFSQYDLDNMAHKFIETLVRHQLNDYGVAKKDYLIEGDSYSL